MVHNSRLIVALVVPAVVLAAGVTAHADSITLYNTGTDAGGLVSAGAANTPWSVSPAGAGNGTAVVLSPGNSYFQWVPNSADSLWIGTADVANTGPVGAYSFNQQFNLSGLDPLTATISGRWAGDDQLLDIRINGVSFGTNGVGAGSIPGTDSWSNWHEFTIAANSAAFTSGVNTISFVINNDDDFLEGVRVELAGTARAIPGPYAVAPLALAGLLASRRRRA